MSDAISAPTYAVDGVSLRQSVIAQVSEPNVTFERDEAYRKLDVREIEILRKDKELHQASIEAFRLQKESKLAQAEIQNLRERNESLQQALMNSRLLSANARNDAENVLSESRIRELEAALSAAIHKIKKNEGELEMWQEKWKDTDTLYNTANSELQDIKDTKNEHRAELDQAYARVKTLQLLFNKQESEAEKLKNTIAHAEQDALNLRDTVESKQREIDQAGRDLAEAKSDVAKLKSVLQVRAETNGVLRQQLEEMNGNTFVISKKEMNKYKKMEVEFKATADKVTELQKSIMLQMDLTKKAEEDLVIANQAAADHKTKSEELNLELMNTRKRVGATGDREKILKREVIKLRQEKSALASELVDLQNDPLGHDEEAKKVREMLHGTTKAKQEEYEEKLKAQRGMKMAEESLNALRNRIAFLLEQQEQTSQLASQWQEQKVIFKSEIEALHNTNTALRTRLANAQGQFINRQIPKLADDANYEDESYRKAYGETKGGPDEDHPYAYKGAVDFLTGKGGSVEDLGEPFDEPPAHAFPVSVESFIERSLFDTICAFSSGARQQPTTNRKSDSHTGFKIKKGGAAGQKPKFKVKTTEKDKGHVEIAISRAAVRGKEEEDASANELLVGTQVNAFLNFCQSRPAERVAGLYAEKICALLNFMYSHVQDMLDQLGSARIDLAQVTSKIATYDQRMQMLRLKYSQERTAKQKNALKFVREQMRLSDMRILMQDLYTKSTDLKEEMELSGIAFLDANKGIVSMLHETDQVCRELSLSSASSGTTTGGVGALEIRLPDSEMDDETLYSLVTLLAGNLEEAKEVDAVSQIHNVEEKGPNEGAHSTGSGLTMMNSRVLSKAIRAISKDYLSRVVMINLKGNCLTDISCQTLGRLLEKSPQLRMLDLRENKISDAGAKVLFDAVRKNVTIMYVTQRQNGFMIEGHREIQGANGKKHTATEETRAEMDRLLDNAKFPLRVDVRYNEANTETIEPMFEQVDYSMFQASQAERAAQLVAETKAAGSPAPKVRLPPGSPAPVQYGYSDSPRGPHRPYTGGTNGQNTPLKGGTMTSIQLAESPYLNSHSRDNSVMAAKMNAARVSWSPGGMAASVGVELKKNARQDSALDDLNKKVKAGTMPPRPQSAGPTGQRGKVSLGARSMTGWKDDGSMSALEMEEGENPLLIGLRSRNNSHDEGKDNHSGLIDLIENRAYSAGGELGSLVDGQLRGETQGVGNMVDSEIRDRLTTGRDTQDDSRKISRKEDGVVKQKSVKEKILNGTKRIYNNKSMFKEMSQPETLLEMMKRTGKGGSNEKRETTIPNALDKGGGQISVNTASTVRSKLLAARDEGERISIHGKAPSSTKNRPSSAPSSRANKKKGKEISNHANTLLNSLQKLNPAVLF